MSKQDIEYCCGEMFGEFINHGTAMKAQNTKLT